MFANCDSCSEPNAKYYFYLINRPILVLKCEQGFVGYKSAASNVLECNKATYETIVVERAENGVVYFKGSWPETSKSLVIAQTSRLGSIHEWEGH